MIYCLTHLWTPRISTWNSSYSGRSWQNISGWKVNWDGEGDAPLGRRRERRESMKFCTEEVRDAEGGGWWPEVGILLRRAGPGDWGTALCMSCATHVGAAAALHLPLKPAVLLMAISKQIKLRLGFALHCWVFHTKLNWLRILKTLASIAVPASLVV